MLAALGLPTDGTCWTRYSRCSACLLSLKPDCICNLFIGVVQPNVRRDLLQVKLFVLNILLLKLKSNSGVLLPIQMIPIVFVQHILHMTIQHRHEASTTMHTKDPFHYNQSIKFCNRRPAQYETRAVRLDTGHTTATCTITRGE